MCVCGVRDARTRPNTTTSLIIEVYMAADDITQLTALTQRVCLVVIVFVVSE